MPSRRPAAPKSRRPAARPAARPTASTSSSRGGRTRATGATKRIGSGSGAPASTQGKGTRRPSGPSRDERRRSRLGLVLPEVLTVRLLVLAVVVLISFVLLLPTVRAAVQQRAQIDQLQAELDASTAERDELRTELERWDDRSYVVQQARSRLSYVLPGDTAWMVVDAEAVEGEPEPAASDGGPVAATSPAGAPWYQAMWESVQVTDRAAAPDEPTASPRPTPAGSGSPAPEESPSQESGGE